MSEFLTQISTASVGPVAARLIPPDQPGSSSRGSAYEAELSYAYWSLGYDAQAYREDHITAERAMTYSAFWGCVQVIAQSLAGVGWGVFQRDSFESRKKMPVEDDVAWTLDLQASPELSAFHWREVMLKDALVNGNGYAEIERTMGGRFLWLHRIDPARVSPVRDGTQLLYEVDNGAGTKPVYLRPEQVFHLKGMGPDGLVGWSVIAMARKAIKLGLQEESFGSNFFGRGPMPGGFVTVPGNLNDVQRKEFRRSFEEVYSGSRNAHRIVVLSNGITFDPASLPNDDAQFLESRAFQALEICRFFRVPPHKLADLTRATFCLPAGQTVLTEDGPKPIECVMVGDLVWSRSEHGLALAPVTVTGSTGSDPILTIRTTNRTLRCNAKHPILCRRKQLTPRTDGRIGGAVTAVGVCTVTWETCYVPAGELRVGDTIVTLSSLPDVGHLEACPTRLPTVGFMEFCGLLLGDGNIIRNPSAASAYVTIARAKTASYMDYYREVIVNEFVDSAGRPVRLQEGERQTRFCSIAATEELIRLGLSGTARTKRVPGWVFRLPQSHQLAFLRGFLDADGSCDKMGRLSFSSCNQTMLGQIRDMCLACGVPVTNLRLQEGVTTLPNGERKAFSQYNFTCSDPGANRRIGSRTPTYVARLEAGRPFGRKSRAYLWYGGPGFDEEGLSLARISSIEIGPAEPVYDLTVEGTHSFIAGGVVVHNSNIEEQEREFVTDCLLPWARRLESEADIKLFGPVNRGRKFTRLNLDSLMRGNSQTQTSTVTAKVTSGLLTVNEGREYFDLNPIDGGDTALIQGAMVRLEDVINPPEPPPPPPLEPPSPGDKPPVPSLPNPEALRRVFGVLLADAYARLLRVDADKARRAANKGKLADHIAEWYALPAALPRVDAALRPALEALALAAGKPGEGGFWSATAACRHVMWCRGDLRERGIAAVEEWESWPAQATELDLRGITP